MRDVSFRDRSEAGRLLADALRASGTEVDIVIGLARGGVQVAAEVARALHLPLDALAVRKVGHPLQPEYAIGALAPGDEAAYVRARDGLTEAELDAEIDRARRAADDLDRRLHARHRPLDPSGRRVALVDDGLATGATMIAAVRWARGAGAEHVVVAVPVAALASAQALRAEADEVVCVAELDPFWSVGTWYGDFDQVSDEEVVALLGEQDTPNVPKTA